MTQCFIVDPGSKFSLFGVTNDDGKDWKWTAQHLETPEDAEMKPGFPTKFAFPLRTVDSIRMGTLGPLSVKISDPIQDLVNRGCYVRRDYVIGKTVEFFENLNVVKSVEVVREGKVVNWDAFYRILYDQWELDPGKPRSEPDFSLMPFVIALPFESGKGDSRRDQMDMTEFVFEVMEVNEFYAQPKAFFNWYHQCENSKDGKQPSEVWCYDDDVTWTCNCNQGVISGIKRVEEAREQTKIVQERKEQTMEGAREFMNCDELRECTCMTREMYIERGPSVILYASFGSLIEEDEAATPNQTEEKTLSE